MALVLHAAAEALRLRVIAPDRPGVGGSSVLRSRTVQQYPADLAELCEQLGESLVTGCAAGGGEVSVRVTQ
jgi:pimeloyl-ACP methyl ester carboxylesterase